MRRLNVPAVWDFLARFYHSINQSFDKNAESPMTPVGPDVFGESSGFPFIQRAYIHLRTIISEMSVIPPADFDPYTTMSLLPPSHYMERV
jgi:hypothetical protein